MAYNIKFKGGGIKMSSYKKEIVKIKHHDREIHSVYYRPNSKEKSPS